MNEALLTVTRAAFDSIALFENAYKQAPGDEELGVQAFMANIRVGNWKPAQLLATRMYKHFGADKLLWWAVMCAVLQVRFLSLSPSPPPSPRSRPPSPLRSLCCTRGCR